MKCIAAIADWYARCGMMRRGATGQCGLSSERLVRYCIPCLNLVLTRALRVTDHLKETGHGKRLR